MNPTGVARIYVSKKRVNDQSKVLDIYIAKMNAIREAYLESSRKIAEEDAEFDKLIRLKR